MLLAEQVRRMTNEKRFLVDAGPYSYTATSWGTLKDFGNVVLDVDGFLVFKYTIAVEAFTGHAGNHRLKVGNYYCSGYPMSENTTTTIVGMVYLAAGTYQLLFEARAKSSGKYVRVTAVEVGLVDIADVAYNAFGEYSAAIEKTLTARMTCVGAIANGVLHVRAFAQTPSAETNWENPGDSYTNGVSISVDGVQRAWRTRNHDSLTHAQYGACCATFEMSVSAGASHTVTVTKDNAGTVVHIAVSVCPWVLGTDRHKPVAFDFPDGSTFYALFEPMLSDPAKYSFLGKQRAISLGDATDYHSSASGTGLLSHSYTFEILKPTSAEWWVSGLQGCVSHVAVDVR